MWQRFTERARKVVFYAQEEAQKFGEGYVSTEHLLLGLLHEDDSVAARVLEAMGLSLDRVRIEVERLLPNGDPRPSQDMTLTPRAKQVIDLAYHEARGLNNNYIGTEHLLLGLIKEGDGLAGRVLSKLGVELTAARREVLSMQEASRGTPPGEDSDSPRAAPISRTMPPDDPWVGLTTETRRAVVFGEMEALRRGQHFLSPEHLLLGLLREPESPACRALVAASIDLQSLHDATVERCRDSGTAIQGESGLSAASNHAFKIAYQERIRSRATETGPEHLLLGLLREPDGVAGRVLEESGVELEALRAAIKNLDATG